MSAPVCTPDAYEPNDTPPEAADFDLVSHNRAVEATLCPGDEDRYSLTVTLPEDAPSRSELRIVLELPLREVGLGPLEVVLEDSMGSPVVTDTTDASGKLVIERPLTGSDAGEYFIRVATAAPDAQLGAHYTLSAIVQPEALTRECQSAPVLVPGSTVGGDTSLPSTRSLASRCASGPSVTDLYAIDVDHPSRLSATVEARGPAAFVVGLRTSCRRADTELACAADIAGDPAELEGVLVEPGRYWVVVQSPTDAQAGPYELTVTAEATACTPADNSCSSLSSAHVCEPTGEGFSSPQCESGCAPSTGTCRTAPAEACESAPLITGSQSLTIDWSEFSDDYRIPDQSCLANLGGTTQTDGPDAVYRVALPADHVLTASLDAADSRAVSLYLLEDCLAPGQRCASGANEDYVDAETLTYHNTSSQPRTLFVVADSAPSVRETAELDLAISARACESWESRCHNGDLQVCNDDRTGWKTIEACRWGCTASRCDSPPGDICADAPRLTPGQTYTASFADYAANDAPVLDHCSVEFPGDRTLHNGPDAYFRVELTQGDLLTAELLSADAASLFVFTDCQAGPAASCRRAEIDAGALEFYAPQTATYFLGVDAFASAADAGFELTVDVQSGVAACQPGGTHCDPSTDELVVCDAQGIAEEGRHACPQGCEPHGCAAPALPNDTCSSAYRLDGSARIVDDLNRYTDDFWMSPRCGVSAQTDGPDAVYEIALAADEVLQATVSTVSSLQPTIYLATDCQDIAGTCRTGGRWENFPNYEASLEYATDTAETVYLIVDAPYFPPDGDFLLDVSVRPAQCQGGQTRCSGPDDLEVCGETRLWTPYDCQGGCANGACNSPAGGICQDAVVVSSGQSVTGDWSGRDTLDIHAPDLGQCRHATPAGTPNADTFYRIDLQAGDLLEVGLRTSASDASVLFLEDCVDFDSCIPGITAHDTKTAHYYAETSGPVWVMVDADTTNTLPQTYGLTFDVTPSATCAPGRPFCVDANTVALCDDDGAAIRSTYTCPSGCARGACHSDHSSIDACSTAPNIGDGIVAYVDPLELSDDIDLSSTNCIPWSRNGAELAYEVTVAPGEVLHAQSDTATFALVDNCADPTASCVGVDDPTMLVDPTGRELFWAPSQTRTVTLVAEFTGVATRSDALVQVEKLSTQCAPGARRCDPSGNAVQVCGANRLWKTRECLTSCTNGRCDLPSGEVCEDPIQVSAPQSIAGSFDDATADISPFGAHCRGHTGAETVYRIDLNAGEVLTGRLLSLAEDVATLYILEDCVRTASQSCIYQTEARDELRFTAPSSGIYYLVVDGNGSGTWGDYVLQLDRQAGFACEPNSTTCEASTGEVRRCLDDGSAYTAAFQCARGCNGDACAPAPTINDTCQSASPIGADTIIADSFSRFADHYGSPNLCGVSNLSGTDAVYEVALGAGEVLRASLEGERRSNAHLFVTSDCTNTSGSCLAHDQTRDRQARVTYHAQAPETVYLIAETEYRSGEDFKLHVETLPADCTPGASSCVDSDTLETCPSGLTEYRDCPAGCTNGACKTPPNDACSGATPLVRDGQFYTYSPRLADDYTDGHSLSGSTLGACTSQSSAGPDALYRIDAQAGDVITAHWTDAPDVLAWLTADCTQAASTCVEASTEGTLTATIPTAGDYWLVVDSPTGAAPASVELDVRVAPRICRPGEGFCHAGSDLMTYCNESGTAYEDYACSGGCTQASGRATCDQPRGEQCVDAIDASNGGVFTVDVNAMDNTFVHRAYTCLSPGSTYGGDAIFRVDLSAGETVETTVMPSNQGSVGVYILDECQTTAPSDACLAGKTGFSGSTVTLGHTATTAGTVYVVVDASRRLETSLPWTVEITKN